MTRRGGHAGELAAVATIGLALVIGAVSAAATSGAAGAAASPGTAVARPVLLAAILAVPGIVGWLGARSRRPSVLIAASAACALQAIVAMSGVTLVFLIPALLFLAAVDDRAGRPIDARPTVNAPPEPRRWLRTAVVAVAIAPIAILAVVAGGILGVLTLVVIAGSAVVRQRYAAAPTMPGLRGVSLGIAAGLLIVALHVGAGAALVATSEEVCWVQHDDGSVHRIPPTPTLSLGPGDRAAGCAGGTFTTEGILLATAALAGEVAIAGVLAATAGPGAGPGPALDQRAGV